MAMVTFQCPNLSFQTACSHWELVQKCYQPGCPGWVSETGITGAKADWKGVFGLHNVPLPLFSGFLPLATTHSIISASSLMITAPVRTLQAHPEAKRLKTTSGHLHFHFRVKP